MDKQKSKFGSKQTKQINNPSLKNSQNQHSRNVQSKLDVTKQSCPNTSIYTKSDNMYKITNYLKFPNEVDDKFSADTYQMNNKFLLFVSFLTLVCSTFSFEISQDNYFISFIKFVRIFLNLIVIFRFLKNNSGNRYFLELSRYLIHTEFLLNIICFSSTEFELKKLMTFLFSVFLINSFLYIDLRFSFFSYISTVLLFLTQSGFPEYTIFFRLIYNIISFNIIPTICLTLVFLNWEIRVNKMIKELWALYDSFKRSYFNMKCIFDEFHFPIFIISRKRLALYYKNNASDKFYEKHKRTKAKTSNFFRNVSESKLEYKFNEIILRDCEKLFESEIEKCVEKNLKYFDFPFGDSEESLMSTKENKSQKFLFNCQFLNFTWVRVVVTPCMWKSQDALMLKFIMINDMISQDFVSEYRRLISQQISVSLENIDYLCGKAPENESSEVIILEEAKELEKISIDKSMKRLQSPTISGAKTGPGSNKNEIPATSRISNQNIVKPRIKTSILDQDYLLLYYLKSSLNMISFNYMTCNAYHSLRINKKETQLANFNLTSFFYYVIHQFRLPSQMRNFNIEFDYGQSGSKSSDSVLANYENYVSVISNIISFVISNSFNPNIKKNLKIFLTFDTFLDEERKSYKVIFEINDGGDNIVEYSILKKLLENTDIYSIGLKETLRYEMMDIGLFVANETLKRYYNSEIIIDKKNILTCLSFKIEGRQVILETSKANPGMSMYRNNYPKINIELPKENLENFYLAKIKEKILDKRQLNIIVEEMPIKEQTNSKIIYKAAYSWKEEEEELFNEKELPDYKKDLTLVNSIEHNLKLRTELHEKKSKHTILKICRENSKRLKKMENLLVLSKIAPPPPLKWDNTSMLENMKYCTPPRFLIVEDNAVSRKSLNRIIKNLDKSYEGYQIDNAANGKEAVHKFKNLFIQGYLFDFILMDIELPEMRGEEATEIIRNYENQFGNIHTNIVAVTQQFDNNKQIFDEYFEKPISHNRFPNYIKQKLKLARPDLPINW